MLGDQDLSRFTTGLTLTAGVDGITTATVELIAREGFDFTTEADVTLDVKAWPGYVLIEEATENGKRWRTEPKPATEVGLP